MTTSPPKRPARMTLAIFEYACTVAQFTIIGFMAASRDKWVVNSVGSRVVSLVDQGFLDRMTRGTRLKESTYRITEKGRARFHELYDDPRLK